jgi:tetratricopeptide (TPR) repeat protein
MDTRLARKRVFAAIAIAAAMAVSALALPSRTVDPPGVPAPQKKKAKALPDDKNPQHQYELGVVALRYGLPDEAVRYGLLAVGLDPGHFDGWNLLGSAYFTKGDYALAAEAYEKAAAIRPDAAEVQRNLGLAYLELKETEKAEAALTKALAAENDAESAFQLGKLCYNAQRYEEALDHTLAAIRRDGKSAKAYNLKGVILNQLGRYAEAAGSFQAGLVLAPEDIGLQINLGIAYLNSEQPAKGKAVLEAVLPKITEEKLRARIEDYLKSIKDDAA